MRIYRLRSALKPGQDFSRTSRQKTCPYGHKESEDCHSASVPLRSIRTPILFPSTISPPSARIYKGKAVWRLSPFSSGKSCELRDFAYGENLYVLMQDFPPPKVERLQPVNAPGPTGENDDREQALPRLSHSADRPKHNIIGPKLCNRLPPSSLA